MITNEIEEDIVRLYKLELLPIVDKFDGTRDVVEYKDNYYVIFKNFHCASGYEVHQVWSITETITRWSFI